MSESLRRLPPAIVLAALLASPPTRGQSANATSAAAAPDDAQVPRIEVTGRHYDNGVGTTDAASQGTIRAELLQSRPALRPGEILEFVPGVAVTQHSGDGKANQYFLRGFNLDHGTDFATSVNGIPVNMPTHGHGQGYSDVNFMIPELVDRIDYRKGPYFARNGDFSAAGSADIVYRSTLDRPFAALVVGGENFKRLASGASMRTDNGATLLGAMELQNDNGPWTVPERLGKASGILTLSGGSRAVGWSASLMAYEARWTATDQIPQRLIDAGSFDGRPFSRFDSLDPADGGRTRRTSLSGDWHRSDESGATRVAAYAIDYGLDLYSDLNYALVRPLEGDQMLQQDRRKVFGMSASRAFDVTIGGLAARTEFGLQLRHDRIRVGLFDTVARQVTGSTRVDDVRETQLGLSTQASFEPLPWLRSVIGLRADQARFGVDSLMDAANSGSASAFRLSPKLSLILGPWARTEFFLNAGRGFHSNDARGTTATVDPKTGEPVNKVPGLVAAGGGEDGACNEGVTGMPSFLASWMAIFS